MPQVRIIGCKRGLRKVEMTKAIRQHTGLSLSFAKGCTDSVLSGAIVVVDVPEQSDAQSLVKDLIALGAVAELAE